jgi:hypothetical protein
MASKSKSKAAKTAASEDYNEDAATGSFEAGLSYTKETMPPEVLTPNGTWTFKGKNVKAKEADEGSDILGRVTFLLTPIRAHEDVDEDEANSGDWKGIAVFHDVRIEKKSDWAKVEKLLSLFGIDTDEGSMGDWIAQFNKTKPEIVATASKRSYNDKQTDELKTVTQLKSFSAVE